MGVIVIYKSKTGFTKKYAQWIAEDLGGDIVEIEKVTIDRLMAYDTIIYGGGLYAGGINGVKLITKHIDKLKDKEIVVFATGVSPSREDVINEVRDKNFIVDQQKYIRFFYLRGGFDYKKLTFGDKLLMTLLKWKIQSKNEKKLTPDERGMLAVYDRPVDFTRKKDIDQIISCIHS